MKDLNGYDDQSLCYVPDEEVEDIFDELTRNTADSTRDFRIDDWD